MPPEYADWRQSPEMRAMPYTEDWKFWPVGPMLLGEEGDMRMSEFEIFANLAVALCASGIIAYMWTVIRNSGEDRWHDPKAVAHLIETAPYHRLNNVFPRKR